MKKLICLVHTLRGVVNPLRKKFRDINSELSFYEGQIVNPLVKVKARKARLKLKKAFTIFNEEMDNLNMFPWNGD